MPKKKYQLTWFPARCKTFHPLWTQRNMSPRNLWKVCSWHSSCILWLVCNHTWERLQVLMSIASLVSNRYWFTGNNVCFVANIFLMKKKWCFQKTFMYVPKNVSKYCMHLNITVKTSWFYQFILGISMLLKSKEISDT